VREREARDGGATAFKFEFKIDREVRRRGGDDEQAFAGQHPIEQANNTYLCSQTSTCWAHLARRETGTRNGGVTAAAAALLPAVLRDGGARRRC
jgi:hypothetical protein